MSAFHSGGHVGGLGKHTQRACSSTRRHSDGYRCSSAESPLAAPSARMNDPHRAIHQIINDGSLASGKWQVGNATLPYLMYGVSG